MPHSGGTVGSSRSFAVTQGAAHLPHKRPGVLPGGGPGVGPGGGPGGGHGGGHVDAVKDPADPQLRGALREGQSSTRRPALPQRRARHSPPSSTLGRRKAAQEEPVWQAPKSGAFFVHEPPKPKLQPPHVVQRPPEGRTRSCVRRRPDALSQPPQAHRDQEPQGAPRPSSARRQVRGQPAAQQEHGVSAGGSAFGAVAGGTRAPSSVAGTPGGAWGRRLQAPGGGGQRVVAHDGDTATTTTPTATSTTGTAATRAGGCETRRGDAPPLPVAQARSRATRPPMIPSSHGQRGGKENGPPGGSSLPGGARKAVAAGTPVLTEGLTEVLIRTTASARESGPLPPSRNVALAPKADARNDGARNRGPCNDEARSGAGRWATVGSTAGSSARPDPAESGTTHHGSGTLHGRADRSHAVPGEARGEQGASGGATRMGGGKRRRASRYAFVVD